MSWLSCVEDYMATQRLFNRCSVRSGFMLGVSHHESRRQALQDRHALSCVGSHMGLTGMLSPCGVKGRRRARLWGAGPRKPLARFVFHVSRRELG
jgi:hypothetical protein